MTIDVTDIITAIMGILVTILTGIALPFIRTRIGAQKWEQLLNIAGVAVQAAEQMYNADCGKEKLVYAIECVKDAMAAAKLHYDEGIVRAAIEAAVLQLKGIQTG